MNDIQEIKNKIEENLSIMENFVDLLKDKNEEIYNISNNEIIAVRQMYEQVCQSIDSKISISQPIDQEIFQLESILRDTEIAIENADRFIKSQESTSMVVTDNDITPGEDDDSTEIVLEEIKEIGFLEENPMAKKILISAIIGSAMYASKWIFDIIRNGVKQAEG
jgi:hypothetical protein